MSTTKAVSADTVDICNASQHPRSTYLLRSHTGKITLVDRSQVPVGLADRADAVAPKWVRVTEVAE